MSIAAPLDSKFSSHAPRGRTFTKHGQQTEKIETYADIYFKDNPNAPIDLDPPEVKLQKLHEKLQAFDLETTEKFQILIQIKSIIYILYGENSIESLKVHAQLGRMYNENHRPQSALRHLQKALELSKILTSVEEKELVSISVEIAEAHLSLRNDNKHETQMHIKQAMDTLAPYVNTEIDDIELRYRRDLVNARVYSAGKKYDLAMEQYQHARQTLSLSDEEKGSQLANLFNEMSKLAETMGDNEKMTEYAGDAFEMFMKLGMTGSARYVQPKVSPEKVREVEEKYGRVDVNTFDNFDIDDQT